MFQQAADCLQVIQPEKLKALMAQDKVNLIDVREPGEYAAEHLSGATLISLSQFDPAKIPHDPDRTVILYCRSSKRSGMAAQKMLVAGYKTVIHLEGGLEAWKAKGYPTAINRNAPISIMRQVQIVAGSFVLVGTLLGAFVSPWFLFMSGFFGAGLLFAGITDTCALGMLLARLPYNQKA